MFLQKCWRAISPLCREPIFLPCPYPCVKAMQYVGPRLVVPPLLHRVCGVGGGGGGGGGKAFNQCKEATRLMPP